MITNLPRQRDLWILLLVILLGAAVVVALRTGAPATTEVASGSGAGASASLTPSAAPTDSAAPTEPAESTGPVQAPSLDSLPPDTRAAFDALPEGYVLVACSHTSATFPDGAMPHMGPVWAQMHPAWRVLPHGYCVDNPSMIKSFDPQELEAP
jgi:hypothetical protein